MSLYQYHRKFFEYQQPGSLASARAVVPLVLRDLAPRSVLDVGCGAGAWLYAYGECGLNELVGVDAAAVQAGHLLVDPARVQTADVGRPFRLGRQFDLVQCLEVAEHLDRGRSETLIDNLVAHGAMVAFSAAPPGQGGEHHVNERPYEFWRRLFRRRGYLACDWIRPLLRDLPDVEPWYRYNLLLFVRDDLQRALPPQLAACRIPDGEPVPDVSPIAYRTRKRLLALLPVPLVTRMAAVKHRIALREQARTARP